MSNSTIAEALTKGQALEDEDKMEEAYECYKSAFEQNQNDTDILQKLAITAQSLEKNTEAIEYWELYMQIKPEDPLSYHQLLDLYYIENKYEYYMTRGKLKTIEGRLPQVPDDYKKAISCTSEEKEIIRARYLMAQTYVILGKTMPAIDEYLKILDYDHNESVYLALANLYYSEDKSAALSTLHRALEEYPESVPAKEMLCKLYLSLGEYEKAEKYAVHNFDKIKSLLMQEKNSEAKELLDSVSEDEKKSPDYSVLMAEYYYNLSDDENTFKYIEIFEKAMPNSPLSNQMRALVYEKQNEECKAHACWGKYYSQKGSYDLALDEFLNAHHCEPENTEVIKDLINIYSVMDDKFACNEFCERLVKYEKDDVATLKRIINFYEEQGIEEKVLDYLFMLAEVAPKDYEILLKLAKHSQNNRNYTDAIKYYEKYLACAPNSDEKEAAKVELNKLTTGETDDEDGFLDKIIKFFSGTKK